ncbi:MAG: DNA polymerase III subunit beta [Candidatus Nanopelagicales bacterium]|nr:DNA polymerase III subunit beta [Candidatus Nanopelagicales bacterium]
MKFVVEQEEFCDAVAWAARTLPARPASPVLAGVQIRAESDHLLLSSFDLEVSAQSRVGAVVEESGPIVVPGRLLAEIAKALPSRPVEFADDGSRVSVKCGRSSFTLPTLPVDDYPQLPEFPSGAGTVRGDVLGQAVSQVAIAASRDDTLPVLTGIRMEFTEDTLTLAATDRYRLAVREIPWNGTPQGSQNALVKARQLAELGRSLGHVSDVRIGLGGADDGRIGFAVTGRELVTRLLHGEFPKYRQLLPTESSCIATARTDELIEAVKRVKLVAAERTSPIRLAFGDGELSLGAGTGDEAQASETLECSVEGDSIEIAFNPDYLLDGLNASGTERVRMAFTTAGKPAVISADADSVTYRYLLMPVRLSD